MTVARRRRKRYSMNIDFHGDFDILIMMILVFIAGAFLGHWVF